MRREGNRNFGVWSPLSGMEVVRNSQNINANSINKLNNLQTGKEEGFKQDFGIVPLNFESPDTGLIAYLNNNNRKVFTGMIHQGWGGNFK